ncbi:MAG: NAD(+) diphosphatase [Candidatus Dormiibacter spiritus]|nr:MAG: NAD(+) diphosphatase [Candidatus Dormibacteraeota bacterium]
MADHGVMALLPRAGALGIAFSAGQVLVREADGGPPLLAELDYPADTEPIWLGELAGKECWGLSLSLPQVPSGLCALSLRELMAAATDQNLVAMVARGAQILEWWDAHAFCGRCGSPTEPHESERARVCPRCHTAHYPRITPAVITLVHRPGEILLARNHLNRSGLFALVAGFVEPGETLEQGVAREVREEVGLEVQEIRYAGSQPWPFPSQLMIGFHARYRSGEIVLQEAEIEEARWFNLGNLPENRPATYSIAGRLIEGWRRTVDEESQGSPSLSPI